jgi:hypothetical protein
MAVKKIQRNGSLNEFAKFVILVAFAATTDAFKSFAPRFLQSQKLKSIGIAARLNSLDVSLRKNSQSFIIKLRAAGTLEEYNVAQARSWNLRHPDS